MGPLVCITTTRYGTPGRSESRSSPSGHIKLDTKQTGAPSAVNLHAGCDVAGTGNGSTATPKRARRGKPRIQAKEKPTGHRASARPYQWRNWRAGNRVTLHSEHEKAVGYPKQSGKRPAIRGGRMTIQFRNIASGRPA